MAKKIKYYQDKADKAFQIYLKEKNPYCLFCGKPISAHHHYFCKASSSAVRYFEGNMIPVCYYHHCRFHSKDSAIFNGLVIEMKGLDWFKDLNRRRGETIKKSIGYYKQYIDLYDIK